MCIRDRGLLLDTTNQQEEKTTNHRGRLEYVGDLSPSSNAEFYYINNQNTAYEYKTNNKSKHNYRIGYGLDITSITGWSMVLNFERFGAPNEGYFNEVYFLLGYVPIDDMKFTLELDQSSIAKFKYTNNYKNFDLKISSKYNFFYDIPYFGTDIIISSSF